MKWTSAGKICKEKGGKKGKERKDQMGVYSVEKGIFFYFSLAFIPNFMSTCSRFLLLTS